MDCLLDCWKHEACWIILSAVNMRDEAFCLNFISILQFTYATEMVTGFALLIQVRQGQIAEHVSIEGLG